MNNYIFPTLALTLTVLVILVLIYPKAKYFSPQKSHQNFELNLALEQINQQIIDLTSDQDLFVNEAFIALCSFAQSNYEEFYSVLKNDSIGDQTKIILILAGHSLEQAEFEKFFEFVCLSYLEGHISDPVYLRLLIPSNKWSNRVIVHFYKKKLREPLNRVKKSPTTSPKIIGIVSELLSGKLTFELAFQ